VMPSSPPPPPIPEEGSPSKEEHKEKKKKRRSKSRDQVDHGLMNGSGGGQRSASVLGGKQVNGESFMGPRMNGHGLPRGLPPPHPFMMVPMNGKAGTFSARQKGMPRPIPPFMMYGGHPPPPFGIHYGPPPPPPPGYYGGPPMPTGRPGSSRALEEPIYMPHNARPLSPVASYQPGHFPHEAYYNQQQYATIDKANRYRKGKSSKAGSKSSKESKTKSHPHQQSSDSNAEDSEFSNNYKAGPYAMHNEQRSRSYGSLANMQFGPNGEALPPGTDLPQNGHHPDSKLLQMMGDLDLGEDLIERSEVPPGLYPPGQPPNMMYGGPLPPTPQAHMVMMPIDSGQQRRKKR